MDRRTHVDTATPASGHRADDGNDSRVGEARLAPALAAPADLMTAAWSRSLPSRIWHRPRHCAQLYATTERVLSPGGRPFRFKGAP